MPRDRIGSYLLYHPFLGSGQLEGELRPVKPIKKLPHAGKKEAIGCSGTGDAPRQNSELDTQQLLELKAVLRLPEQLLRLRKMDIAERLPQRQQTVGGDYRRRQRLGNMPLHLFPQIADELVNPLGTELDTGELLGSAVYSLQPTARPVHQRFDEVDFRMDEGEFAAEQCWPPENDVFAPRLDAFLYPLRTAEPHQIGCARTVRNEDAQPPFAPLPFVSHPGHTGPHLNIGRRIGPDIAYAEKFRAVDVPEREIVEQVAERTDTQLACEHPRALLTHAGQELYIVIEYGSHLPATCFRYQK